MKNLWACLLALCVLLTACGQNTAAAWQEQYDLGMKYLNAGSYEEAVIAFTAAIDIDPKRAEAYIGRGDAYVGIGEDLDAARADYETALRLNDRLEQVYVKLADVLEAAGDREKAIEILREGALVTGSADLQAEADRRYADLMGVPEENGDLMLIDFIGMTVGDLTERFGSDLLYLDGWFSGAAKGFYYADLRIPAVFYIIDEERRGYAQSGDEIAIVEYFPEEQMFFSQAAPGIPASATYREMLDAGWQGHFYTEGDAWLQEMGETSLFTVDIVPEVSASFYWFDHADPYTTPADGIQLYRMR